MSRKFHFAASKSIVRAAVAAGAVLVVSGAPMLTGSASAEEVTKTEDRSATHVIEQLTGDFSDFSDLFSAIRTDILGEPGPINGWQ